VVSKDKDLGELAILRGAPPKVVWLRIGNCSTAAVEAALRHNIETITAFAEDSDRVVLELFDR
jgi:predicted nuclease of predicted toxin-antitoxin system